MSLNKNPLVKILASMVMAIALLVGGGGITAYASAASLPGDALYSVKTSIEDARASLTGDNATLARLYLEFAGHRLDEIQALIAAGQTSHLGQASSQFRSEIQNALDAISALSKSDPTAAAALQSQADAILKGFEDKLSAIQTTAPADVQDAIQNAVEASQLQTGNTNSNLNSNANENLNENENSNENLNENENENSNSNGNEDLNANTNANQNTNGPEVENENQNGNSITNTNSNQNHNENEDHGGTTTNANSNSNSNGDDGGGHD